MCGLCGIVIGNKARRSTAEIDALADTFIRLLLGSEHRGPYATGVAWVKRNGTMQVTKKPLPACSFIQSEAFIEWLLGVDQQVLYLMGHTRWPSRGSVLNPKNNHPLVLPIVENGLLPDKDAVVARNCSGLGQVALTHNGTIADHTYHLKQMGFSRTTQVDSELLARIAQQHSGQDGLNLDAFLADLAPLCGSMSLALMATTRPEEIILIKGNMPLEVRINPHSRTLLYASEIRILDQTIGNEDGWEELPMAHGEGLLINAHAWKIRRVPFTFRGIDAKATASYTGATHRKDK